MNRRKFFTALSALPFLGFLKPADPDLENKLHVILSVRGKEYALGIELTDDDRSNKWKMDLLADSMRETAYEKLGLLNEDGWVKFE